MSSRKPPLFTLPPYSYVSGLHPHPHSDPGGHSFGKEMIEPPLNDIEESRAWEVFLWGVALFDRGYYWEAHEAWEAIWRITDDRQCRHRLQALIKLAAAAVKGREGRVEGVRRHLERSVQLLRGPKPSSPAWLSADWSQLRSRTEELLAAPQSLVDTRSEAVVVSTPLQIHEYLLASAD